MDLSFYHHFTKAVYSNSILKTFKWKTSIYRYFDEEWHLGMSTTNIDAQLIKVLNKIRDENNSKRARGNYYFYVQSVDAIVEVAIANRTWQTTIDKYKNELDVCVKNAEYQFNANFDKLTRLLNRSGFEEEIKKSLKKRLDGEHATQADALSSSSYIALITFDIDHFKQVNDSYSHQYGDAVLRAFSWKLTEQVKQLKEHKKLELILARLGGEEFDLLIVNLKNKEEAGQIAESIRAAVEDDLLPNKEQWKSISRDLKLGKMALPNDQERHVTASIGYKVSSLQKNGDPIKIYSELKGQADVALYRAKADGRNCVRNFDAIRRKHGRVLQSFQDLSHIVIDIGSDVGVKRGDVYAVRIPQFSGDVPLFQEDGRSKKKLGTFPKLTNGRIVVVDAQKEISFCQVIDKSINGIFPIGSRLEYIPMGIGRPIVSSCSFPLSGALLEPEKFIDELSSAIKSNQLSTFCVFSVREVDAGDSSSATQQNANNVRTLSLADLVRACMPATTTLGLIRENQVAAFICGMDTPEEYIEKIVSASNKDISITCGYVLNGTIENSEPQWLKLCADDLLYIARVANYVAISQRVKDTHAPRKILFNLTSATQALYLLRLRRRHEDALVDYHRLSKIGVDTPQFHNQLAACIVDSRDMDRMPVAERALERAVSSSDDSTLTLNLAVAKVFLGHYSQAYDYFMTFQAAFENDNLYWLYFLARAKCCHEMYISGAKVSEQDKTLLGKAIKRALVSPLPELPIEHQWIHDIRQFAHQMKI